MSDPLSPTGLVLGNEGRLHVYASYDGTQVFAQLFRADLEVCTLKFVRTGAGATFDEAIADLTAKLDGTP